MELWWGEDDEDEQYVSLPAWADSTPDIKTEPGDPIGLKTVQYILMSQTQMNLSHFHTAGMSALGLEICPSVSDTMNNRYPINTTSMKFNITNNTNINSIRGHLVGTKFLHFVTNIGSSIVGLPEHENIWYKVLDKDVMSHEILRFYVDYNKIREYNLTLRQIASTILKDDCTWEVSPDFMGMIDVYLPSAYLDTWLARLDHIICGTNNILSVHTSIDNNVITVGSDIYAVSKLDFIDKRTIFSNNVAEVEKCFGIEAARSVLNKLLKSSTVSNFMTRTGTVQPFAKSSSEIQHKGLLFAMGFERPKDDIKRALKNPSRYTGTSVYTNIIIGKDPETIFRVT